MRRTTIMVDQELLEQVTRMLGEKSYSAAINFALAETLRQAKLKELWSFVGSGVWEGDLSAMRSDRVESPSSKSSRGRLGSRTTRQPRSPRTP